jgi:hypothetical protein
MANLNPNSTNYFHSYEPNTNDLTMAMDYNALGQPIIRTLDAGAGATGSLDAFGRQKIASPYTLFDSQHRYRKNDKFWQSLDTNATITHDANASLVNMNVTDEDGSKAVMETKRVFLYQPGKALEILCTFTMAAGETGLRQRVGYFTTTNGIFVEKDGTDVYLVLRSYSTGSLVEERIAQSNWNLDTLDGVGNNDNPTGIVLDFDKSQILFIDIEWLGVGTVRCGFVVNGAFVLAHAFHHANEITGTYMTTASLPVRYEIENTAATTQSNTLKSICSSVVSSGGFQPSGKQYTVGRDLTYYTMSSKGTYYHLVSIRLNSSRLDAIVIPDGVNVLTNSNQNIQYKVVVNATFATPLTWTTHTNGNVDYSTTNSVVSSQGDVVATKYIVNKGEAVVLSERELQQLQLRRDGGTGTAYILSVIATPDNNNTTVSGNIGWIEPAQD